MLHSNSHISVIVPAYNAERTIADCVESLLRQEVEKDKYRITVVDNGSQDRTGDILRGFGNRITLLSEARRGPAAVRNRGILSGRGTLLAFIDADCVADRNWLGNIVSLLSEPGVGMVGGRILAKSPHEPVRKFGETIHDHKRAIESCNPPYVISMNAATHREVFDKVGLFNTDFRRGEDVDLSWRILAAGYVLRYAPDAIIYHENEPRLSGLLREGCQHGYYGVKVKRRHNAYLIRSGRNRNFFGNSRRTLVDFMSYFRGRSRHEQHLYGAVFNSGKIFGSFLGSLRFGYFEI